MKPVVEAPVMPVATRPPSGTLLATVVTAAALATTLLAAQGGAGDLTGLIPRRLPVWAALPTLVAVSVIVLAVWVLRDFHPRASAGLSAAALGSLVPLWASWSWLPASLRAAATAVPAMAVIGVGQVVLGWAPGQSRILRLLRWCAIGLSAGAVLLLILAYNPFDDPGCVRTCARVSPVLEGLLSTRGAVMVASWLTVGAALLLGSAVVGGRGRGAPRPVTLMGLAALGAFIATHSARWMAWGDPAVMRVLPALELAVVGAVACAVCAVAARTVQRRAAVDRVVSRLAGPGDVAGALDGGVIDVHYAMPGTGRWVDARGGAAPEPPAGKGHTIQSDDGRPVLRLVLQRSTDPNEMLSALTAAGRLALRNAQLSAVTKAHVADVQSSQRRVVAASDAERRRIERDLHDGAQQRLVSVAFHLSLARSRADALTASLLARADERVRDSLARLRRLAHGIFPNALIEEGLEAALEDLVTSAEVPASVDVRLQGTLGVEASMAAYSTVHAVLGRLHRQVASTLVTICAVQQDDVLTIRVAVDGVVVDLGDLTDVVDRVGAVGGCLTTSVSDEDPRARETVVVAVIPCGS